MSSVSVPPSRRSPLAAARGRVATPLGIAVVYAGLSLSWVLLSDAVVDRLIRDRLSLSRVRTTEAAVFIAATGVVLYGLVRQSSVALVRVQRALVTSYEATLEGWTRALDMRDRATTDHSLRVTELTVRLAAALGVTGEALEHVRRGALLHDIGKMAVPDAILQKPGPLTADEWAVMRRHPLFARQLLEPIEYLRPALDIPVYHHEKWDGTGYPYGLKGEQIPLAARAFAVVDVYDALSFDRPYRPAWSRGEVREYIRSRAGTEFDPRVVAAFLRIMDSDPRTETPPARWPATDTPSPAPSPPASPASGRPC